MSDVITDAPIVPVENFTDAVFVLRSPKFVPIRPQDGHGQQFVITLNRDTVVHLAGNEHYERRRILSSLFTRATIEAYEKDILLPALEERIQACAPGQPVDLLSLCRQTFTILLARFVGLDNLDTDEQRQAFEEDFVLLERGRRGKYSDHPEELAREGLAAQDRIIERHFEPAWRRRVALLDQEGGAGERPELDDLLGVMARHRAHYANWSEGAVAREAALFMVASVGSTSNAVCHAVADLDAWRRANPEQADRLADPDFLARAFRESVRLHQVNVVYRAAVEDVELPSGAVLKRDELARISRHAVNRELERRSGNEVRFDPFRVVPAEAHDYGLAFGEGPHACIGKVMVLGDRSTVREGRQPRDGLALATLQRLFNHGLETIEDNPPKLFTDMSRETWQSFPVVFTART